MTGNVRRIGPFTTTLWRYPAKGGWTFAIVPKQHAPPTHPWGRTPVAATVDGVSWTTSVFRDSKTDRSLLPVPAARRGSKTSGETVTVTLEYEIEDE